jgi:ornithine carbamoyltransferase
MVKHLISIADIEGVIYDLFTKAHELKEEAKRGIFEKSLADKTLAMIFEKASTRTRVSFEVAMAQMGGHAIHLDETQIQLYRGESLKDTALTLSRYVDGIMIRARSHGDVIELARYSSVPVINGLTDLEHPCQATSDLFTIKEKKGFDDTKLAYVGDGNNVCNSLILGSSMVGLDISIACPKGYEPDSKILAMAKKKASGRGSRVEVTNDPRGAVREADVVYTDVWISMGQEKDREKRLDAFEEFQVNSELLEVANNPLVMHCLPAQRGREITNDVMDGPNSIVFDQAENRLHLQKALLYYLMRSN